MKIQEVKYSDNMIWKSLREVKPYKQDRKSDIVDLKPMNIFLTKHAVERLNSRFGVTDDRLEVAWYLKKQFPAKGVVPYIKKKHDGTYTAEVDLRLGNVDIVAIIVIKEDRYILETAYVNINTDNYNKAFEHSTNSYEKAQHEKRETIEFDQMLADQLFKSEKEKKEFFAMSPVQKTKILKKKKKAVKDKYFTFDDLLLEAQKTATISFKNIIIEDEDPELVTEYNKQPEKSIRDEVSDMFPDW